MHFPYEQDKDVLKTMVEYARLSLNAFSDMVLCEDKHKDMGGRERAKSNRKRKI